MDFEQLSRQFWQDGYLVIEGFFEDDTMGRLDGLIREHFGVDPAFWHTDEFLASAQTEVIPWFPQREGVAAFDEIADDPRLQALTEAVLGAGWRDDYSMVMYSKQGTTGQAWHQDCPPDDPSRHNLNRLVYTSTITPELGGEVVVVPGSFRRGLLPAGDPHGTFDDQVVIAPTRGTLVLLHGHTWHRVLPINGPCRFSTNYRAAPKGTPDDITDICVYRNMRYQFSTESVVEQRTGWA